MDGNKPAGFIACVMMLSINGRQLEIPEELAIETFLGLAIGSVDGAVLAEILERHCAE